jgi:hypothetical protein
LHRLKPLIASVESAAMALEWSALQVRRCAPDRNGTISSHAGRQPMPTEGVPVVASDQ